MIALLSLASLVGAATSVSAMAQSKYSLPNTLPDLSKCAAETLQYSCENTTAVTDGCCSINRGGLVLQTQFWSTYTGLEKKGQLLPAESWTIHGLWPDNCDGSYPEYCDLSRQYDPTPGTLPNGTAIPPYKGPSLDKIIQEFGRFDLLDYMNTYWINQGAPNWNFWGHEFSKHATCTSPFDVGCYGSTYKKGQDLINFFDAVIRAYKRYPTYDMLAAAGVVPSNSTTYTYQQLIAPLKAQTGATPYLGCTTNGTVLDEVWYFHHVYGTEQFGTFKNLDSGSPSSCSQTAGIHYYERTPASEHVVG